MVSLLALMAPFFQRGDDGAAAAGAGGGLVGLIIGLFVVVCFWRILGKAGEPGWYSIIPLWNTLVLLKVAGRPMWWILLLFVPFLNFVILIMTMLSLGKSFGKGAAFSILLLTCFSPIGFAILAFDSSPYLGPGGRRF